MFLDDQLFKICKESIVETPEQIQSLYSTIMNKCDSYLKNRIKESIHPKSSGKDIKAIVDRTFNLFDAFVKQLEKSNDGKLSILGNTFKEHNFKKAYFKNEEIKELYLKL